MYTGMGCGNLLFIAIIQQIAIEHSRCNAFAVFFAMTIDLLKYKRATQQAMLHALKPGS
jgi:hypothetical protein